MARKKKERILKEFVNTQFKEIKKEKSSSISPEEFERDEAESENISGDNFTPVTRRTAPVLQASGTSQNLERTAETAPVATRTDTTDSSGNQNQYSANYSARYDNANYEARRDEEPVVRPTVRASGVLNDIRNVDAQELRRLQPTWQDQAPVQAQGSLDRNLPDERVYRPADDAVTERTSQINRRRRMF
ncbi:MAG: hypothetical protein KKE50_01815 [Nanoarchaeota archaeon]|nr:hypothetical protein [Nanoarchaeota archaeon]